MGSGIYKRTEKHIEINRKAHMGQKNRFAWKKGTIPWNKGMKTPQKTLDKLSIIRKGKKHSIKTRKKLADLHRGNKCLFWKGGLTQKNSLIRQSLEYRLWRESVFARDNYTCLWCGQRGGVLHPDHIKPFSLFPELRFAIDNGRTLCKECHKKTDTYGWKLINKKQ
jgi:hypothetical protein